jgi:catechol 2,3-dioxygenase-like lactoylglutathione lyase family enzyme
MTQEIIANRASTASMDMKFEVVAIPVADVDRAKAFYTKLGWRLDADFPLDNGFRVVQFTPRLGVLGPFRRQRLRTISW